jgi:hypothetical protein
VQRRLKGDKHTDLGRERCIVNYTLSSVAQCPVPLCPAVQQTEKKNKRNIQPPVQTSHDPWHINNFPGRICRSQPMGTLIADTVIQLSLKWESLTEKKEYQRDRGSASLLCRGRGRELQSNEGGRGEEGWKERTNSVVQFVYARTTYIHTHI